MLVYCLSKQKEFEKRYKNIIRSKYKLIWYVTYTTCNRVFISIGHVRPVVCLKQIGMSKLLQNFNEIGTVRYQYYFVC